MSLTVRFDDLLHLRQGDEKMTMGGTPTAVAPLTTPAQWEAKAEALRTLYRWTLGEQPAGLADLPLDLRTEHEADAGDHLHRTVSYLVGPDERIRAHVLIPKDRPRPAPAVVTIHPTTALGKEQAIGRDPSPNGQDRAYGLHLARRGYVTISYDLDASNERLYPGRQPFDNTPFYDRYPDWSGRGRDLYDFSRAVDVLEATPEADARRVAALGHSQGGGITLDAMAVEPRLKAGVCNCGDWPFRLSKNPYNRCRTGWWVGQPRLRPFALCGKPMPIDVHEKLALAAPRPMMMLMALDDCGYHAEEAWLSRPALEDMERHVRSVYRLLGADDAAFALELHLKGHSFLEAERELAYTFLDRHLRP